MLYRRLGKTDLKVSEIGFGAWGIGGGWGERDDKTALAALERSLELGLNFIDTALAYGQGHSEKLVGEAVRKSGKSAIIATKVPPKNLIWPAQKGTYFRDVFPKAYVLECTDRSLDNLGLAQMDLQQFHVWNDEWATQDEWHDVVRELKSSGRTKAYGISINDHEPDNVLKALETGIVDTVQVIFNIFDQAPLTNLFPACQKNDVGVIVRVPLDEGGLTGAITPETQFEEGDWRNNYFKDDRKQEVSERVQKLSFLLDNGIANIAEAALRFTLSHPAVSTVIPGMRSPKRVEANMAVSDGNLLSKEDLEQLKAHAWQRNFYR